MNNTVSQLQTDLNNKIMKAMIGIPQPYPLTIPPTGWLAMNGQVINATKYPILASIYGANLPDLRGMFIRGWDNGKGIDSDRALLSNQTAIKNYNVTIPNTGWSWRYRDGKVINNGNLAIGTGWTEYAESLESIGESAGPLNVPLTIDPTPSNIAFNYICYAG